MKYLMKLLCILLALLLCGCAAGQEDAAQTTEMTNQTEPLAQTTEGSLPEEASTAPPVKVTMPDYTFSYSGELADVISLQEHTDGSGITFLVKLSEQTTPVFDMFYDSQDGDLVTVLTDGSGNRVSVAFQMPDAPEGLEQADLQLFYRVQDAVNEIVASLQLQ